MSCAETVEPVEVPFGAWTRVGPRNHELGGAGIPDGTGRGNEIYTSVRSSRLFLAVVRRSVVLVFVRFRREYVVVIAGRVFTEPHAPVTC